MFKNEYLMNRKLVVEYVFKIFGTKMIIGAIISLTLFLMYLTNKDITGYVFLTCSFVSLLSIVVLPAIMVYNIENVSKKMHGGKEKKTLVEFGNNIIMNEGKVHLEFEYSQILNITQTKNFIILNLGENRAVLVYKNGFTKGNEKEFIKFIEEKIHN